MTPTKQTRATEEALRCAFCHDNQQSAHGEIKREWSPEHRMFFNVCRMHARADGMIDGVCPTCHGRKVIVPLGYSGEPWDCPTCTKDSPPTDLLRALLAERDTLLAERDQLRSCLYSLQFTLQTPSAWSDDLSERQWLVNIRAEAQQIIRDALSLTEKP